MIKIFLVDVSNLYLHFRCFTCFAVLGLALLVMAALLTIVGHFLRGHKMLVASILYSFGGKTSFLSLV